jgi:RNA polymerase sigma-70 factor (ECF subfamily)
MVGDVSVADDIHDATLDAAIGGDAMAFARIVQAHHDDMARVCQLICGDPDLAQDAVQAAWPVVWRKLGQLRDPDKLRPWLITVAANEARQLIRREHRDRIVAIDVVEIGSSIGDPATRASDADLLAAFRRLPAADRELLALRYVAGFDATENGQANRMPASTVRSRLSRVIARLRTEMEA